MTLSQTIVSMKVFRNHCAIFGILLDRRVQSWVVVFSIPSLWLILAKLPIFDICLVSVSFAMRGGGFMLDLSKPLPPVIGIELVNFETEEDPTDSSWLP
jgi:hypothetical protein